MSYFDPSECKDSTIKITEDDIQEATRYIDALLVRIGVSAIVGPVPHEVRSLAVAIAYRNRALFAAGRGVSGGDDVFMIKYKAYSDQVRYWEPLITPELLKQETQKRSLSPNISMGRG